MLEHSLYKYIAYIANNAVVEASSDPALATTSISRWAKIGQHKRRLRWFLPALDIIINRAVIRRPSNPNPCVATHEIYYNMIIYYTMLGATGILVPDYAMLCYYLRYERYYCRSRLCARWQTHRSPVPRSFGSQGVA